MTAKPAIIVISSHVVRGTVGNRAAAFALEVLGYPVWCVPTVTLPWHPGQGPSSRIVANDTQFATLLDELGSSPWLGEVGAVLSGYLGDVAQVNAVAQLVNAVKTANPDALYALDPVIGDGGALYVPEQQADAMREELLPLADLATPNRFELSWLSGTALAEDQMAVLSASQALGKSMACAQPMVLATSAPALMKGATGNLLLHDEKATMAEHRIIDGPPNGLGDLTAALMVGHLLAKADPIAAMKATTASVFEVMMTSAKAGSDELVLERSIQSLLRPQSPIQTRSLRT